MDTLLPSFPLLRASSLGRSLKREGGEEEGRRRGGRGDPQTLRAIKLEAPLLPPPPL